MNPEISYKTNLLGHLRGLSIRLSMLLIILAADGVDAKPVAGPGLPEHVTVPSLNSKSNQEDSLLNSAAIRVRDQMRTFLGCIYYNNFNSGGYCDSSTWQGRAVLEGVKACQKAIGRKICAEMVKQDPNLSSGMRKCDASSVCKYNSFELMKLDFEKCKDGYILGTGELLTGLGDALSGLASRAENHVRKSTDNIRARSEFLKHCSSAECKLQVARDIHPSLGMSRIPELEDLLAKSSGYSAVWIEAERKRWEAHYFAQKRNVAPKSLWQRAQEAEEIARRREAHETQTTESKIFAAAFEALQEKLDGLECFDLKTQAQLVCWGAAYIVDPTIVATAALKGPALARTAYSHFSENSASFHVLQKARGLPESYVPLEQIIGKAIAEVPIKNLPPTMRVVRYRNELGQEIVALEKAVKLPNGQVKRSIRELPIDPLTGTFDANLPVARRFLEDMVRDLNGKVTLAVIDIDNLGYVSKNFTHGFKGSPAQMRANSKAIGDQYITAVARAMKEVIGDKGLIWRTGGDEFAIVIHETNPEKAQALLQQIAARVRESDVREIFTKESRVRAQAFRDEKSKGTANPAEFRLGYAPYSQPNVSIGSIVVNQESLADAFAAAEKQASLHKIATKEKFAADTTKYGGSAPEPDAVPRLNFIAPVQRPAMGEDIAKADSINSLKLSAEAPILAETRSRQIFRVGDFSIVQYQNESGELILRGERFFNRADGARSFSAPEIFTNAKTGFIDGSHPRSRDLMQAFTKSGRTPNRGAIWINTENLGLANNFAEGGMATGDRLLQRTAAIIRDVSDPSGGSLPIKLSGSEFILLTENTAPVQVRNFTKMIQSRLSQDAEIKSIYAAQERHLRQLVEAANSQPNRDSARRNAQAALDKFLEAKSRMFSVHGTAINGAEELEAVLSRTRGLRYTD
jgi:GGDEF domain-containing protein